MIESGSSAIRGNHSIHNSKEGAPSEREAIVQ